MTDNLHIDKQHIWHPYSAMQSDMPIFEVESAHGVTLSLKNGQELLDGMASWWCVIHGYNHPAINAALKTQIDKMSHVMFGGLTHEPAIELTRKLVDITPPGLESVFYSDSGSVAVEVAMKMAIQYWQAKGISRKKHFLSLKHGYHGDTMGAMSVCDPVTGMHSLFKNAIQQQSFIEQPRSRFGETCSDKDIANLEEAIQQNSDNTAALILEPIVQGAGGMWFYSADYLKAAAELCKQNNILLIADEIATGFGRTGALFACNHADITPDIMCVGKSLTGGYMTLAATLTTNDVSSTIDSGEPGLFMHGPTFMANPLACTAANASIDLLMETDWQANINRISQQLSQGLTACGDLASVEEVRVIGAIGVIEMKQPVDMKSITLAFVDAGVWIRPFGKLIYLMPPYIISDKELKRLCNALLSVISSQKL